jgi:uncharacterized membrane protein
LITDGFDFIAVITALCGVLVWVEHQHPLPVFRWLPSVVLVMFGSMALYTAGLWEMTDSVRTMRAGVRDNLIPAMLFLMSLRFDLRIMKRLGARLIVLCLASTASVMVGFIVVHQLLRGWLGDETPLTFATMSAGWTGGTQNFVAVKEALAVSDAAMTYTLLMGAVCYSIWLVFVIALKPFKATADRLLLAEDRDIDSVLAALDDGKQKDSATLPTLLFMLGSALLVASLSRYLGSQLSAIGFLNPMVWAIIFSSLLGMLCAPGRLGREPGSDEIAGMMLFIIVALIGAEVSLSAIAEAPRYILAGFMILAVHAILLLGVARLLRVNLLLVGIASIASIGSAPSAAVVGAAYGRSLVPVAIVMSLIGSMLGSFVGLTVAEILVALNPA